MSVEVSARDADDAESVVVSWLNPLHPGNVTVERRSGDPLPSILVKHLSSNEIEEEGFSDALVSVSIMCDKRLGWDAARDHANNAHRRMLLLAEFLEDVTLSGGRLATIDFVKVFSRPTWEPYGDDQILRKIGRYTVGLSYATLS